ncbi:hypothetical protein [Snuella lapsa]|uniref:Redoxin domain-containing protein n=1 Tax=Snuella lapsa TaxID=870481 RepID=A0ABP6X673_9FLAO
MMEIYFKKALVLLMPIYFIISCQNVKGEKQIDSIKNQNNGILDEKLLIPDSLRIYAPFNNYISDSLEISNANFKIYSIINSSCITCISNIKLWNSIIVEFKKYEVPVILICESDDEFELMKYLCESRKINDFSYPFFLDERREWFKLNKFMKNDDDFNTVLTDVNNKVILKGNPLYSKEIKGLYINKIKGEFKMLH